MKAKREEGREKEHRPENDKLLSELATLGWTVKRVTGNPDGRMSVMLTREKATEKPASRGGRRTPKAD